MGLYRRGVTWWMNYTVNGHQQCESTGTTNKRLAQKILDSKKADIIEGRFRILPSRAPHFDSFSKEFLDSVRHPNTKKRYATSVKKLMEYFGNVPLSAVLADQIERFKAERLKNGIRAATVNRDLAVLRRIFKIASRRRLVSTDVLMATVMLEEKKERRQPHILTFEEKKIGCSPRLQITFEC
jgi:predicted nucleic acid-binding protein